MPSIDALQKLLEQDPADAFVLYGLAHEYAKLSQHDTAVGYYDRCIASDAGYCYAYYHKARSQQSMGKVNDARKTINAGIKAAKKAGDDHAEYELRALMEGLDG